MFFARIQWHVGSKMSRTRHYFCVMIFLLKLSIFTSFMLLAFFSLQVYTVTKFPFKAPHFWTRKRVALCCVGIWLLAGLVGLADIFIYLYLDFDKWIKWWTFQMVVLSIIVIIQIALKILTCWEIFITGRNSGQSRRSKHHRITTTVMIMVVIQMFTAFPYVVILQLGHDVFSLSLNLLIEIRTYHSPVAWLNFCVNPIIYVLRLPDYRSSLLSLCGCRKRKIQTAADPEKNEQIELSPTTSQPPS